MARRKRESRIMWRHQGGAWRAYADFRDYANVGGRREALIPHGETIATTDRRQAEQLMARRLGELQALREGRSIADSVTPVGIAELTRRHLRIAKQRGAAGDEWIAATQGFLERALTYFAPTRRIDSIRTKDVAAWIQWLYTVTTNRGTLMKEPTVRHHLNALSRLFRRAAELGAVPLGFNPAAALLEKPQKGESTTEYLEVHDAALALEAARILPSENDVLSGPFAHALIATYLLTGGRHSEVLGLETDDVSFDQRTVRFRPNEWRTLKNRYSKRIVPLWPQLEEILRHYVFDVRVRQPGRLLFPSFVAGRERMLTDFRKLLDRVAVRACILAAVLDPNTGKQRRTEKGQRIWTGRFLRTRLFRHTYCSARLQTLDGGRPVSTFTVSRELGHVNEDMVHRVYSHLGERRHRAEVVEFRVEQHRDILGDRLKELEFGTTLALGNRTAVEHKCLARYK